MKALRIRTLLIAVMLFNALAPTTTVAQAESVEQGGLSIPAFERPEASSGDRPTELSQTDLESQPSVLFIENVGQFDSRIKFIVNGPEGAIILTEEAIWLSVRDVVPADDLTSLDNVSSFENQNAEKEVKQTNLKITFPGGNLHAQLKPLNQVDTTISFFYGNDPSRWQTNVPAWGGVRYEDIYPGVNLEVTSDSSGELKWDFVVEEQLRFATTPVLKIEGAESLTLDQDQLLVKTGTRGLVLPLPKMHFKKGSARILPMAAPASPRLNENEVSIPFSLQTEDLQTGEATSIRSQASLAAETSSSTDNGLVYSTFLGESTSANAVATDSANHAYVTGTVWPLSNFPTTPGTFHPMPAGNADIFVTKFNAAGTSLVYSTYIGGINVDISNAIAVDDSGDAYLTGWTDSPDFPTTNSAFDRTLDGTKVDAFVLKLNSTGTQLHYSTFLGGNNEERGHSITTFLGEAYISGGTASTNFPTSGAFQGSYGGGTSDGFVTKLNLSGSGLVYSTYIGGQADECAAYAQNVRCTLAVDSSGAAYVTGSTSSSDFPTTAGAWDRTLSGFTEVFILKLQPNGNVLAFSTFLGGGGLTAHVAIGMSGIYVSGYAGPDFPTTGNAWDGTYNGAYDIFLTKLQSDGSGLIFSTYVGGSGYDWVTGLALDEAGNPIIFGETQSADFPVTPDAFQSTGGTSSAAFVTKFNFTGTFMIYSSYLGGNGSERMGGGASGQANTVYMAGETKSSNFPTTAGAFDGTYAESIPGYGDAFVTKWNIAATHDCPGTTSSPIAEAVKSVVGEQAYCGNYYDRLITLPPGQTAFEQFGDLARTAKYEVDFVTMEWEEYDSDETVGHPGRLFLSGIQELYNDFQIHPENYPEGVRIRILLGLKWYEGKDQRVSVMEDLQALGIPRTPPDLDWTIEVAHYRDGLLRSGKHSHVKMLIVDGKDVIAAGYNMHYVYLRANPSHDMGVQIRGPIAQNALQVFDGLWIGARRCEIPNATFESCREEADVDTSHNPALSIPVMAGNDVVFSLFRDRQDKTADNAIFAALNAADGEVNVIQNRFALFQDPPVTELYARGVLNALQKGNGQVQVNILATGGKEYAISLAGICKLQTRLLMEDPFGTHALAARLSTKENAIHTKALSIDGRFVIVGSQNWDLSAWGNNGPISLAEYSLGVDSEAAASEFNTTFWNEWQAANPTLCAGGSQSSLQAAIDQAAPGTAIFVPSGVYRGSIVVNKPIILVGAGANETVFQSQGNEPAFRVTSSDVTIASMKITGGTGYGIELLDSSPHSLRNIQISRMVFENNAQGGILAQGQIAGSPMNYSIENSTFIGGTDGITINMLETQADPSIVRNNIFFGQSGTPIHILSSDDSRVEYSYNLFDDCGAGSCVTNWHVGDLSSVSSEHDNLFDLDPLFADPANSVYQLSAGSPATDAGDPSLTDEIHYDGNHDETVQIDIGAFEYVPVEQNAAPVVNAGDDQAVDFEEAVVVNATYSDADNSESHSARIDWGDGTVEDVAVTMSGPGAGQVAGEHSYTVPGNYTIEVCVIDLYGAVGCDTINVQGNQPPNAKPRVHAGDDQTIDLINSITVHATYSDPDSSEGHSATIDWGDGSVENVPVTATGSGMGEVAGEHAYSTGGNYIVEICVTDPGGAAGCDIKNVRVIPPSNMATVVAGGTHTCSISSTGGVYCWGSNSHGQLGRGPTPSDQPGLVTGLSSGVVAIALGDEHTCALTSTGGVKCWGYNYNGQLGDGTTTDRNTPADVSGLTSGVIAITAGTSHTCAVTTTGGAKCWGENTYGQLGIGQPTADKTTPVNVSGLTSGVAMISAGEEFTCALTTSGGAKCWGYNHSGQVGDGTTTQRNRPTNVSGLTSGAAKISTGRAHACALTTSGAVMCWGEDYLQQLGNGSSGSSNTPVNVVGLTSGVIAVTAGDSHTCALTSNGGVKCWGQEPVGDGTYTRWGTPVDVSGLTMGVVTVDAGRGHTCAITTSGYLKCWGSNSAGKLGIGRTGSYSVPMDTNGFTKDVVAIETGANQTCAITTAGGIKCWGDNSDGQLGDGTTNRRFIPTDVSGLTSGVASVSAGGAMMWSHTCALTTSGGVKCWGKNIDGQLGDGTTAQRTVPVDVSGLTSGIVAITTGGDHTCALTTNGGVKCWGKNIDGQLGDGTTAKHLTPMDVSGLTEGVVAISAGEAHTCALTVGGGIKCWGANSNDQLGDGTGTRQLTPVDVSGLSSGIVAISAGRSHTCALTVEGGVKCWGDNTWGKLGDGTLNPRSTPVNVNGLTSGVVAVSAGSIHTCALTTSGGVKCWGFNSTGEVGDGTFTYRTAPVDVSGLASGVAAISTGGSFIADGHTCALMNSGEVKCWGNNSEGQIGNGMAASMPTPVSALFGPE